MFNEEEEKNPHMQRLADQFKLFTLRLKFPADGPDCVEGANRILDNKLLKSQPAAVITRKALRGKNKYRM